eukprot:TRINITY_DN6782_c0_g1_i1.p1 TRINITY_DN6782_c0_g1~~TRINITY_DN6782_c0_g1_i1.p1  ORF type:complete len:170 (+),score=32.39 TRINITY_DN6782_c0_g1_i1:578-1087(+)
MEFNLVVSGEDGCAAQGKVPDGTSRPKNWGRVATGTLHGLGGEEVVGREKGGLLACPTVRRGGTLVRRKSSFWVAAEQMRGDDVTTTSVPGSDASVSLADVYTMLVEADDARSDTLLSVATLTQFLAAINLPNPHSALLSRHIDTAASHVSLEAFEALAADVLPLLDDA